VGSGLLTTSILDLDFRYFDRRSRQRWDQLFKVGRGGGRLGERSQKRSRGKEGGD